MNPGNISLLNAVVLIALGLVGYFTSETPSPTALIPVVVGVILLATNPGLRKNNKAIAHIAVMLTLTDASTPALGPEFGIAVSQSCVGDE